MAILKIEKCPRTVLWVSTYHPANKDSFYPAAVDSVQGCSHCWVFLGETQDGMMNEYQCRYCGERVLF